MKLRNNRGCVDSWFLASVLFGTLCVMVDSQALDFHEGDCLGGMEYWFIPTKNSFAEATRRCDAFHDSGYVVTSVLVAEEAKQLASDLARDLDLQILPFWIVLPTKNLEEDEMNHSSEHCLQGIYDAIDNSWDKVETLTTKKTACTSTLISFCQRPCQARARSLNAEHQSRQETTEPSDLKKDFKFIISYASIVAVLYFTAKLFILREQIMIDEYQNDIEKLEGKFTVGLSSTLSQLRTQLRTQIGQSLVNTPKPAEVSL